MALLTYTWLLAESKLLLAAALHTLYRRLELPPVLLRRGQLWVGQPRRRQQDGQRVLPAQTDGPCVCAVEYVHVCVGGVRACILVYMCVCVDRYGQYSVGRMSRIHFCWS